VVHPGRTDPNAVLYGTYQLVDQRSNAIVKADWQIGQYSLDLRDVARFLFGDIEIHVVDSQEPWEIAEAWGTIPEGGYIVFYRNSSTTRAIRDGDGSDAGFMTAGYSTRETMASTSSGSTMKTP
jgi:hypothetical protein